MVSAGAAALSLTGPLGWAVGLAAAYIDGQFILPNLLGKGRGVARAPKTLDIPVGSNDAGAPRITAWGRRVRVPTHILWQDKKVRESTAGSATKGGTSVPYRRVYFDALLSLNDRKTERLHQLVGNGKLLIYRSRNTVEIASSAMNVTVTPSVSVRLDMQTTQELDFNDRFRVGDYVYLRNFAVTGGDASGPWRVSAVTAHGTAPSSITVTPARGQMRTAITVAASAWPPSTVQRADDAAYDDNGGAFGVWTIQANPPLLAGIRIASLSERQAALFPVGTSVILRGIREPANSTELFPGTVFRVRNAYAIGGGLTPYFVDLLPISGPGVSPSLAPFLTSLAADWHASVSLVSDRFAGKYFNSGFNPDAYYHDGSRFQPEDALLAAAKGSGLVPAYRGTACQGLDDFFSEDFGNQLPFAGEALIDADEAMTWQEIFVQVCERGGIARRFVDVTGLDPTPFDGFYVRGAPPTRTAIQPLLVAKSVVAQDRDGQVCFFHTWRADVVQIENGPAFSHLGARLHGDQPTDEKIVFENDALEDLPTQVTVRHQDPDNVHAEGVQAFALRNPIGVSWKNEQDLDLSTLVLARKDARNLAATVLKRAWINGTTVKLELMGHYCDLLENDIITLTDDEGIPVTVRIAQRDEGANEIIRIVGVREDLALPVSGSPVQRVSDLPTVRPEYQPADLFVPTLPAFSDSEAQSPGVYLLAGNTLGPWAGAIVQQSDDDGQTWRTVATIATKGRYGRLAEPMPAYGGSSPSEDWRVPEGADVLSLDVEWESGEEPQTVQDDIVNPPAARGQNLCAIQDIATGRWEIASFAEATATGPSTYSLTGWRRGLNGTWREAIAGTKPEGGLLAMLDSMTFLEFAGNRQIRHLMLRVVVPGQVPESADPLTLDVSSWVNASPQPVREIGKTIGSSPFNARFEVLLAGTRTTEQIGSDREAMFEPFEEYRFDIWSPDGNRIVRRKTVTAKNTGSPVLRDRWVDYPAAEQTQDGYTPSASTTFVVDCVQVGQFGESASVKQTI